MPARLSVNNFADDATIFVVPDAVSTLPVTNLQVPDRDAVWRSSSVASQVIIGHWNGAGRKPNCFGLFRHNGHGGKVRLVLYQDIGLTTIAYDSGLVDLFSVVPLGSFDWGVDPLGLGPSDPLGGEAPFVHWFTAAACAAFAVVLYGFGGSGSPYWEASRLWLGKYLQFTYGSTAAELRPREATTVRRTRTGVRRPNAGGRWMELALELGWVDEADYPLVLDAIKQAGLANDVLFSALAGSGGRAERDHTINGCFESLGPLRWAHLSRAGRLTITEN